MRVQQSVADVLDTLSTENALSTAEIFEAHCKKLSEVIVDWKNMGSFEFGKADLQEVLTFNEARELLRKVMYNQHITADEKKSTE